MSTMWKRIACFFIITVVISFFAGCKNEQTDSTGNPSSSSEEKMMDELIVFPVSGGGNPIQSGHNFEEEAILFLDERLLPDTLPVYDNQYLFDETGHQVREASEERIRQQKEELQNLIQAIDGSVNDDLFSYHGTDSGIVEYIKENGEYFLSGAGNVSFTKRIEEPSTEIVEGWIYNSKTLSVVLERAGIENPIYVQMEEQNGDKNVRLEVDIIEKPTDVYEQIFNYNFKRIKTIWYSESNLISISFTDSIPKKNGSVRLTPFEDVKRRIQELDSVKYIIGVKVLYIPSFETDSLVPAYQVEIIDKGDQFSDLLVKATE